MKVKTLLLVAAAGAAVAYFLDSERGAERRAAAKQRAEHLKEQTLPKLQELRRHTEEVVSDVRDEAVFAGNGASAPLLPS